MADGLPKCLPSEAIKAQIVSEVRIDIKKALHENIPDQFAPKIERINGDGAEEVNFAQIVTIFDYVHFILPLVLLVLLLCLRMYHHQQLMLGS